MVYINEITHYILIKQLLHMCYMLDINEITHSIYQLNNSYIYIYILYARYQ